MTGPVAAIIVSWNAAPWLPRTLDALAAQTRRPDRILVVDNASTDGSAAVAEGREGVEVVALDENLGFAAANNLAAARVPECEWLVFVNPDAFPEPDWLERLLDAARTAPDCAMFASDLRDAARPEMWDGIGDAYHVSGLAWRVGHGRPVGALPAGPIEVFSPCGAAALVRRDAFDDVGGFDPAYFCYIEDVDLGFRIRLRGGRCLLVPGAIVNHVGSALTGRRSAFSVYHGHRNLVWTWVKNMPGLYLWLYLPQHLLLTLASIVRFGAAGQLGPILRAKRDAVKGLGRVMAERRRVQARRTAPASAVVKAMTHGLATPYLEHRSR